MAETLRVLMACGFSPFREDIGGGNTVVLNLMNTLAEKGVEVTLLTVSRRGKKMSRYRNIPIEYAPYLPEPLFTITEGQMICKLTKGKKYDIIHGPGQEMAFPAHLKKREKIKTPIVTTYHGSDIPPPPFIRYPQRHLSARFGAYAIKNSDYTTAPSRWLMEKITGSMQIRSERMGVIHNGVNSKEFKSTEGPERPYDIIYVGGLQKTKGVNYLIEAISIINMEKGKVNAAVVGDGPEIKHLKRLAKRTGLSENIEFTGYQKPPEIIKFFSKSKIMAFPSQRENFPMVVLEAMAAGLPVVSTLVGGIPEQVVDKETGYLVPPRNPGDLAEACARLLGDDRLRRRLGSAGRKRVLTNFTWDKIADQYIEVYKKLADGILYGER